MGVLAVKYQAPSQVTLTTGHLNCSKISPSLPLGSKIVKKAWEALPQETYAAIIAAIGAPDLSAAFLEKGHVCTADEAILRAAALGPARAARAAL
jgi:hypothetical protein